ncbi:MAG: MerR family DNA-binding protein [Acidobacteriota bacterium]|nr:MerR family DNA-binding protein [Acidobacteriota bacterium]MDH3527979.1 MerR family DNA-binding protein [Acidobacteriota bacterium]
MSNITTSVLARKANVPVFTVRHYTRIGLLNPGRLESNGYKVYKDSDIKLLRFITNAKELGFMLKEIAEIINMADHGESPCPVVREIIEKRVAENKKKIAQLQRLQKKIEGAKEQWKSMKDEVPDGHSVCHLIESFSE